MSYNTVMPAKYLILDYSDNMDSEDPEKKARLFCEDVTGKKFVWYMNNNDQQLESFKKATSVYMGPEDTIASSKFVVTLQGVKHQVPGKFPTYTSKSGFFLNRGEAAESFNNERAIYAARRRIEEIQSSSMPDSEKVIRINEIAVSTLFAVTERFVPAKRPEIVEESVTGFNPENDPTLPAVLDAVIAESNNVATVVEKEAVVAVTETIADTSEPSLFIRSIMEAQGMPVAVETDLEVTEAFVVEQGAQKYVDATDNVVSEVIPENGAESELTDVSAEVTVQTNVVEEHIPVILPDDVKEKIAHSAYETERRDTFTEEKPHMNMEISHPSPKNEVNNAPAPSFRPGIPKFRPPTIGQKALAPRTPGM